MATYRNAYEFLVEVSGRYRAMVTYSDVGVVRPRWKAGPHSCWFETQFNRPNSLRFQFTRPHPYRKLRHVLTKYIAGCDGATAYFVTEACGKPPVIEPQASVEMTVAGATGISQGTAHTIGSLLLECIGGFSFLMLQRPRFRRPRKFGGVDCYRVSGVLPPMGRFTLWISMGDLLLRKVVNHRYRSEEVRLRIEVDEPISAEVFCAPKPDQSLSLAPFAHSTLSI